MYWKTVLVHGQHFGQASNNLVNKTNAYKQIIDNVQKRKSTFKEMPIEEKANALPAFKQLSINKPLPKINGLRSLPLFL